MEKDFFAVQIAPVLLLIELGSCELFLLWLPLDRDTTLKLLVDLVGTREHKGCRFLREGARTVP